MTLGQYRAPAQVSVSGISEGSTVNAVLRRYPSTRPVFEHLFVNPRIEGADYLDEVAWRHGTDLDALLHELSRAA